MTRVLILTGNHLCHNPRVMKEAGALARAGFDVTVLGAWLDPVLRERDIQILEAAPFRFEPVIDIQTNAASFRVSRLQRKAALISHKLSHYESPWQLGYSYGALRRASDRPADLYMAHSEVGMAVAHDLLRHGRRVGVDLEDWFSEDLPAEARKQRPLDLLCRYERDLLCRGAYQSSPSSAMSAALAKQYGCSTPAVVYNAFAWSEREAIDGEAKDRRDRVRPSIHWFSQTLGPGRGLEELMAALRFLSSPAELHLRGSFDSNGEEWLRSLAPQPWHDRIFLHPPVPNDELLSRISEHDVGFAGEQNFCRSRDLTVTNKILYYLLGGLAVVATDTSGQREVANLAPGAVALYPPGDTRRLAAEIDRLLGSVERLHQAKAAALAACESLFCWERQEKNLVEGFERAIFGSREPTSRNASAHSATR